MSDRPLHGADSAEAYVLRRFRVVMEDDAGGRHNVIIPAALGIHDAQAQARHRFPYESPVHVEEVAA
ncbi:MAG: hypothetical protein M3N43_14805 [Actinomycetota bacterium]|nr:hypothetical protein [Actinomycetota bacterium]